MSRYSRLRSVQRRNASASYAEATCRVGASAHLGSDEHPGVGTLAQEAPHQTLAAPVAVDVRGVDERHAGVDRGRERGERIVLVDRPQSPPTCQAPSPTTETARPVRPSTCCSTALYPTSRESALDRGVRFR